MIWMTWRQFRASAVAVFGALALAAAVLLATGPALADLFRAAGADFFDRLANDSTKTAVFYAGTAVTYAVPAVVGAFWGAPLVARELEQGTHRLVWNQSITRTRWLATKLGFTALAAAFAGLIGLAMTWWSTPIDDAVVGQGGRRGVGVGLLSVPRLWPDLFGSRGVVPLGMAVLALAVGVTAGLLVRRTVPAMAITLVAVVAVQIAMPLVVQRHLLPPEELTTQITEENLDSISAIGSPDSQEDVVIENLTVSIDKPGAWITENETLDPSGKVMSLLPDWFGECPNTGPDQDAASAACFARLADDGYRQRVEYQPASRFWSLQWVETGILLGLAGLLCGFSFWKIRRDLT